MQLYFFYVNPVSANSSETLDLRIKICVMMLQMRNFVRVWVYEIQLRLFFTRIYEEVDSRRSSSQSFGSVGGVRSVMGCIDWWWDHMSEFSSSFMVSIQSFNKWLRVRAQMSEHFFGVSPGYIQRTGGMPWCEKIHCVLYNSLCESALTTYVISRFRL